MHRPPCRAPSPIRSPQARISAPVDYNTATAEVTIIVSPPVTGPSDTGTVTLTVGGALAASYPYGAADTPSSVAEGLAAHPASGSLVTLTASGDTLNVVANQASKASDYSYTLEAVTNSPTRFPQPSFVYSEVSGQLPPGTSEVIGYLDGGADQQTTSTPAQIYSYCVGQSCPIPNNGYDAAGNLTGYTDSVMGVWGFSYDPLNRLVTATAASNAPAPYASNFGCWNYDAFGNRTSESMSTTPCGSSPMPMISWAHYNGNNQFTNTSQALGGVAYDASGDVLNDGVNQYLYDGEGRICAVASTPMPGMTAMTGYLYDADGVRVAKGTISTWSCDPAANGFQTTNDYILGPGGEQVTEMGMNTTSGGGNVMTWQHTNVWAAGKLIATYDGDGLHFYFDDPLGTRRVQTDYAGVVERNCQSLPYGDGETCATTPTEHLFTGKERDAESGNDYFGARYYNPTTGRFLSEDPSGFGGGINLYEYADDNPTNETDPSGELPIPPILMPTLPTQGPGNVLPGFTKQDGVCTTGPFANMMNSRPCVKECCKAHDDCYTANHCNATSFLAPWPGASGPCQMCNLAVEMCIASADKSTGGGKCKKCQQ